MSIEYRCADCHELKEYCSCRICLNCDNKALDDNEFCSPECRQELERDHLASMHLHE